MKSYLFVLVLLANVVCLINEMGHSFDPASPLEQAVAASHSIRTENPALTKIARAISGNR